MLSVMALFLPSVRLEHTQEKHLTAAPLYGNLQGLPEDITLVEKGKPWTNIPVY